MTILEMNHVSKAFGGSQALSDIHLSVEEGEARDAGRPCEPPEAAGHPASTTRKQSDECWCSAVLFLLFIHRNICFLHFLKPENLFSSACCPRKHIPLQHKLRHIFLIQHNLIQIYILTPLPAKPLPEGIAHHI